ncbi:MAG: hypothetical protein HY319_14475 [Armatimonadetes bacterium]|nr:hypothetical protein [Armatimonadota bacterium]
MKVEMLVDLPEEQSLELVLPQMSPGSPARSQNQPANLSQFQVLDRSGKPLSFEKLEQGGWRLPALPRGPVTVTYTVRADRFSDVRSHLTDEHAYLNGPGALLYIRGHEHDLPSTVELVNLPDPTWESSSTLPRVLGRNHAFYAGQYDDLADSNIKAGHFVSASAYAGDTTITVVQQGTPPFEHLSINGTTPQQNAQDFARVYRAFLADFGEFPRERYRVSAPRPLGVESGDHYVIHKHYMHNGPNSTSGFEHYHGHELVRHKSAEYAIHRASEDDVRLDENRTMAHELVHKLLAKYVQHEGIDSCELSRVQKTDGLWVTEGVTNWLGYLLERQAGLLTRDQYLRRWERVIDTYHRDYALDPTNARDDSLDAQLGNSNYYNKGSIAALALDLELRQMSGGKRSFLDVLQKLKAEFGGTGEFHAFEDVRRITREVAADYSGGAQWVDDFFKRHLVGRERVDVNRALHHAGYRLLDRADAWQPGELRLPGVRVVVDREGRPGLVADAEKAPRAEPFPLLIPSLGLTLSAALEVGGVREDGPAFEAGLKWYEGKKPEQVLFRTALGEVDLAHPGEIPAAPVEAVVFRFKEASAFTGQERAVEIAVPVTPASRTVLEELPQVSLEQRALRQGWLREFPESVLSGPLA